MLTPYRFEIKYLENTFGINLKIIVNLFEIDSELTFYQFRLNYFETLLTLTIYEIAFKPFVIVIYYLKKLLKHNT